MIKHITLNNTIKMPFCMLLSLSMKSFILKLKKFLKFLRIFFSKLSFRFFVERDLSPTTQSHTPTYPYQQSRSRDLLNNSGYRGEMPCLNQIFNVKLSIVNIGALTQALLGFCIWISLWVESISNDSNDLCRTTTHIFKIVNIGGQKWLH